MAQIDGEGQEHPVFYASKTCTPAESRYSATEGECLAVLWAITKYREYLVQLQDEHSAEIQTLKQDQASARRESAQLQTALLRERELTLRLWSYLKTVFGITCRLELKQAENEAETSSIAIAEVERELNAISERRILAGLVTKNRVDLETASAVTALEGYLKSASQVA